MKNVRFARALCAFALIAGTGGVALAQQQPDVQETQADPLQPLPDDAQTQADPVQADVYDAPGAEAAMAEMADRFGISELAPGQYRWADSIPASGPTKIVISLTDQLAFVYRADELIGVATISSGKKDHETPTGVFPILAKEKDHKSKKFDDAPMPYMQRLNEYGVALHGGNVPGYPASHGCVRLPMAFAARLFALTTTGTDVIIEA
ncbi:MAG: L,D-transpeptidase family protein [Sphingomicrobium sp.]|nr:L,D-transpeptidase family protein [Sphingomonadales bacterium]